MNADNVPSNADAFVSTTSDASSGDSPSSSISDTGSLADKPVRRLGHYRLLDVIGRGGMGIVYAAHDTKLDRKVAIKQVRAEGRTNPQRRFIREALAMAKLSHPNVIPIFEIGEWDGSTFLVMEYVEGSTLRAWLGTPRSPAEILAVFKSAARGLIAAHQKGMVHRDFKPDNVMLGDDGRVRVLDFGLARVTDEEVTPSGDDLTLGDELSPVLRPFTQTGAVLGTPAYMAPEQFRGARPDAAGDQFSFCVALYEALYRERPFSNETLDVTDDDERAGAPMAGAEIRPPSSDATVPAWLRALVCRGLAQKPGDRHESMQALLDALVAGELEHDADHRVPPKYVFVAHHDVDKLAVLRLCEDLLDHGVRSWLDIWEYEPDADRRERSDEALAKAPAVLLCHGSGGWAPSPVLAARIARDPSTVYRVGLPGSAPSQEGIELDANNWDDAVVELARLVGIDRERRDWLVDEAERAGVASDQLSPYRGLEAFREQDARWMFGREDEVGELIELIRADQTRFMTIIGASGSGKSSLVMAGLCPALRHGVLGDGCDWAIAYLRPGPRPCETLAHALVNLQGTRDAIADALQVKRLRDELLASADTLRMVASRMSTNGSKILLVVDQLEELFTEAGLGSEAEAPGATAFVSNLLEASSPVAGFGNLWVVATLRADFVQRGLEVGELARALKGGTYFALPPMGEQQIRAAIERPAKRVGFSIESKLVEKLVVAAANQAGRLPLLQHVLRELWQRRDQQARMLAHEVYAETGGLEGAIAVAAERALEALRRELGPQADSVTRRLMTRLVHLGATTSGNTRRRVARDELGHDEQTKRVLDAFVRGARVLVASEDEGVEGVEISHEALLREWTTLVAWLDADRDALRLRQELTASAAEHRARGGREYLWGKARVEEAKRMLAASVVELNDAEQHFLAASERVVRQRERRIWGAVVGALVAAAVVVVVVLQKNEDIRTQKSAVELKGTQLEQTNTELEQKDREQKRTLSVQRGLRARMLIPENRESEALLLAVQAVGVYGPDWASIPSEATEGLEHVLADDAIVVQSSVILEGHEGPIRALAFSPDGTRLATSGDDKTARIWNPTTGDLIATLRGHVDYIYALTYSPDGSRLVTGSYDKIARIWDANTGDLISSLHGHQHEVDTVAYSPDGSRLATSSWDGTARVWDPNTGDLIASVQSYWASVVYSPDGSRLATAGEDKAARIWDSNTGRLIATLHGHENFLPALVISPDGTRLATASLDKTARIWDFDTGRLIATLHGHEDSVLEIAYSPDGSRLATGSIDKTAHVWDPDNGNLIATLEGHLGSVTALAYSPDGSRLATANSDGTARIWDPDTGNLIASLQGHGGHVTALAYSPDGSLLATASFDTTARIWDPNPRNRVVTLQGHDDVVVDLAFSPDGSRLATASFDTTARIWDPNNGNLLATLQGHQKIIFDLAYSPDGSRLATASHDDTARIWDPDTGKLIASLQGHESGASILAYSPDGSRLATADGLRTVRIWDPDNGDLIATLHGHTDQTRDLVYSPDGSRLATASGDKTVRIWDPNTGNLIATLRGHEAPLRTLAYSPDGSLLATAGEDNLARVWDPNTGNLIATLRGHEDDVRALAYAPDSSRLATGSFDKTTRIWDPNTGKLIATLEGHLDEVHRLTYSPDGTRIATASAEDTALIWDANTGKLIATLEGHLDEVNMLTYSPDGTRIATASADHTAKIWDAKTGELITELKDRIGLLQPDGSIAWPIPPETLTRIGCERLASFEETYPEAADLCDPLLAN
jgi:WD40 repeat protein/serine/threonine protein kinase